MSDPMNRRMFLRGAGGSVLAIPFLHSLTSRAFAQDPGPPEVGKCFFAVATGHGGLWSENLYPADTVLTQETQYAGRAVRYGDLPSLPDGNGKMVLSPMCSARSDWLTPELIRKFNILRGIDIPYGIGHHSGGYLGNFADKNRGGRLSGLPTKGYEAPSIDQVMAYSQSFYGESDFNSNQITIVKIKIRCQSV